MGANFFFQAKREIRNEGKIDDPRGIKVNPHKIELFPFFTCLQ